MVLNTPLWVAFSLKVLFWLSQLCRLSLIFTVKRQKQPLGCSVKKTALKNFPKFAEEHLCRSVFFNKVAGLRSATLLKKILWHRCFSVNFCDIFQSTYFEEHLQTAASGKIYIYRSITVKNHAKLKIHITLLVRLFFSYFLCQFKDSHQELTKEKNLKNLRQRKVFCTSYFLFENRCYQLHLCYIMYSSECSEV